MKYKEKNQKENKTEAERDSQTCTKLSQGEDRERQGGCQGGGAGLVSLHGRQCLLQPGAAALGVGLWQQHGIGRKDAC